MLALDGVLLPDEGTDVTDHRLLSTLSIRLYTCTRKQTPTVTTYQTAEKQSEPVL